MKPMLALGVVLVIVGALVALALPGLRPLGGALLICGAGLVVYSFLPRSQGARGRRGPYSWEDDEKPRGPRQIYTAAPGEVAPRPRPPAQEPSFVSPTPGTIPPIRQQPSGGDAEYTAGHAEVPPPRERQKPAAEYSPPPGQMLTDDATVAPPPLPGYPTDNLPADDSDLPPMAPPPQH
jgi:hypothetical protein